MHEELAQVGEENYYDAPVLSVDMVQRGYSVDYPTTVYATRQERSGIVGLVYPDGTFVRTVPTHIGQTIQLTTDLGEVELTCVWDGAREDPTGGHTKGLLLGSYDTNGKVWEIAVSAFQEPDEYEAAAVQNWRKRVKLRPPASYGSGGRAGRGRPQGNEIEMADRTWDRMHSKEQLQREAQ